MDINKIKLEILESNIEALKSEPTVPMIENVKAQQMLISMIVGQELNEKTITPYIGLFYSCLESYKSKFEIKDLIIFIESRKFLLEDNSIYSFEDLEPAINKIELGILEVKLNLRNNLKLKDIISYFNILISVLKQDGHLVE